MNPLISIIIPVYNAENTLNRCVDSIVNQTFNDWELLLIDDGSKDKSSKICDRYAAKDQRIKVFHKKNGGVSSARNLGLDNAKGEWITFVDSDDYIYDNIFDIISSHEEDFLIFSYDINHNGKIRSGEGIPSYYSSYPIKTVLNKYIYTNLFRTPWSKFFKRRLIDALRFDTQISIGEDTLFVLQYLRKCESFFISDKKYYIWSEGNISCANKYKLDTNKAVYIVSCLYSEYKSLNIRCIKFEILIYWFYYSLCEDDLYKNGAIWFKNKTIMQLWQNIKFSCSIKARIIIRKCRLISFFFTLYYKKRLFNNM